MSPEDLEIFISQTGSVQEITRGLFFAACLFFAQQKVPSSANEVNGENPFGRKILESKDMHDLCQVRRKTIVN